MTESFEGISCFVIGPIGDRHAAAESDARKRYESSLRVWDYAIWPACQSLGINPVRADRIAEPGEITEQVFRYLRDSELVIADVTGGNPNVMYELGLRHSLQKPTIQIGQIINESEDLPFDITVIRTIKFRPTETGLFEARDTLRNAIVAVMKSGILSVTASRVWNEASESQLREIAATESSGEGQSSSDDDLGFLDVLVKAEEALPLLNDVALNLAEVIEQLAPLAENMSLKMAEAERRGQGASARLAIASEFANELEQPAEKIEQLANDFTGHLEDIDAGIRFQINALRNEPSILETDESAHQFSEAITGLAQASNEGLGQISELADVIKNLGMVSSKLRPVTLKMFTALRRISDSANLINGWQNQIAAVAKTN